MPETRIHDWLARLPQSGPWLVSLLLAAAIAVECARLAIALLGGKPIDELAPLGPGRQTEVHRAADVQSIIAAHLFGVATADPSLQDPAHAPLTSANLVLAGTIATQDPKHGLAIISSGGPSKVYSVGDTVGGASLYSVYLDQVILNRGGSLEALKLPHIMLTGRTTPAQAMIGANAQTIANLNNIRRMVQQNPGILNEVIRAVASYDNKAGRLRGFRIYPGRNQRAFAGLGLKSGDLITAINGTPLDDPQRSETVFNTIETSNQAAVTIDRNGQTINLTLNIAQVAAEANRDLGTPGRTPQPFVPRPVGANPNF